MKQIVLTGRRSKPVFIFMLSAVCLFAFGTIVYFNYPDIPDHNRFITDWLGGDKNVKLYSLYYLVILVLCFFQNNTPLINIISVVLLTSSVISKFLIANFIFKREIENESDLNKNFSFGPVKADLRTIILLAVFLTGLCSNLMFKPSATMMLGYLPVNTWHNSTTIFLMPFALWLFYKSYLFFINHKEKNNNYYSLLELLLLTIFSVFIKPSYFFVFSIAFPLYYLLRFGINKNLFLTGLVSVFSTAALLMVYRYVYTGSDSSVTINPFHVWSHWTTNIFLACVTSVFFPLLFLIFYFRETLRDHLLSYAWIHMITAILIYILLTETGGREMHANFGWQTIICNYILFISTCILFFKLIIKKNSFGNKDKIIFASFILHVFFGLVYLMKLPLYGPR